MPRSATKANKAVGRDAVMKEWPLCKTSVVPERVKGGCDLTIMDSTQPIQAIDSEKERSIYQRVTLAPSKWANTFSDSSLLPDNENDGGGKGGGSYPSVSDGAGDLNWDRSAAKTMREILDQIKSPIERETSKIIVSIFDEDNVTLAKAETQRKRRQVRSGTRLFTNFCKEIELTFNGAEIAPEFDDVFEQKRIPVFEQTRMLDVTDFCLREDVNKNKHVFVTLDDDRGSPIELSTTTRQFAQAIVSNNGYVVLTPEDWTLTRLDGKSMQPFSDFLYLNQPIPARWDDYMKRDRNNRILFIRFLCRQLLGDGDSRIKLAPNRLFIISGHHFTVGDLKILGFNDDEIPEDPQELRRIPISVIYENGQKFLKLEMGLENGWGEADNAFTFFAARLNCRTIKLVSTDTDWAWNSGMYKVLAQYNPIGSMSLDQDIFLYRRMRKPVEKKSKSKKRKLIDEEPEQQTQQPTEYTSTTTTTTTTSSSSNTTPFSSNAKEKEGVEMVDEWISITTLYNCIVKDGRLKHLGPAAVSSVIAALTLAGADYTYPYFFVNHTTFLNALLTFALKMDAPLCFWNNQTSLFDINITVFVRFLSLAYGLKFCGYKNPGELYYKSPSEIAYEINRTQKIDKKKYPSDLDCVYSYKQLLLCMHMMSDLGKKQDPVRDLFKYGYTSNDGSKTLTKDNITRLIVAAE